MPSIYAAQALLPSGWTSNVRVEIAGSDIIGVFAGFAPGSGDTRVDYLLPSIANTHSHSFQRAMAGMTERRSEAKDTFWTWRKVMYRFLDLLTPDEIEIIASLTFIEMLEQGFSAVAEFHYVHHQPGGEPYAHLSETSQRILAAAQRTGIGLTMLPVLYSYGGLDKRPLMGGQIRFGNDVERFGKLFSEVETAMRMMPADSHIGYAPHSLRATDADQLKLLCDSVKGRPMHIHAAEQQLEVQDVQSGLGARPVRWLLDNMPVAENWCLIHSTQMDDGEVVDLAKSGAVAGLCPITESNLGDGIFAGQAFLSAHGAIGIGSEAPRRRRARGAAR